MVEGSGGGSEEIEIQKAKSIKLSEAVEIFYGDQKYTLQCEEDEMGRMHLTKRRIIFFFFTGVTGTCSASWSLLWLGEGGQESCSSDDEEWTSWSLSSIATGATVHSAISNHKGAHTKRFFRVKKRGLWHGRNEKDPRRTTRRELGVFGSRFGTSGVNYVQARRMRTRRETKKY